MGGVIAVIIVVVVWLTFFHNAPAKVKTSGGDTYTVKSDEPNYTEIKKQEPFSSTEIINVCSESGNCYDLEADISNTFDDDGVLHKSVDTVHFDNGGYLEFGGIELPGSGEDQDGHIWDLSQ